MDADLIGKTVVVTGATSGIGQAAAEMLARRGAFVIGTGRSKERCAETERRLQQWNPDGAAACLVADLSLQSQVRGLASQVQHIIAQKGTGHLDGLINNAGTFTYWLTLTQEGYEMQWAVNHLAPFLLTHELLPLLIAAPAGRIVTVSSASHYGSRIQWDDVQLRRRYNGLRAYGQSKLANVLFTQALNSRLAGQSNARAFAADPGLVKTDIGLKGTPALVRWIWQRRRSGGITAEESARGVVYLASEPSIHGSSEIYWKHGSPKTPSREAQKRESAERLWTLTERMCGT